MMPRSEASHRRWLWLKNPVTAALVTALVVSQAVFWLLTGMVVLHHLGVL